MNDGPDGTRRDLLRKVVLHGRLGEDFGREWTLALNRPVEFGPAIDINVPGFAKYMMRAHEDGIAFQVLLDGEEVPFEVLKGPMGRETRQIDVIPVPIGSGGKTGGIIQTILGVLLIALAFVPGFQTVAPLLLGAGIGLLLGGVVTLLTPVPKTPSELAELGEPGSGIGGQVNTIRPGVPVPIIYGKVLVGTATVSVGIQSNTASGVVGTRQRMRILDLLGEGPIKGLVEDPDHGKKRSIFLNEVQAVEGSGKEVFEFEFEERTGELDQETMTKFSASELTQSVGIQLESAVPITRVTLSSSELKMVRVNLSISGLSFADEEKGIRPSNFQYKITVRDQGGSGNLIDAVTNQVRLIVTTRRNLTHEIVLSGTGPWQVEVEMLSANGDQKTQRVASFDSIVEVGDVQLNHPLSSLVGIDLDSKQFPQIPQRQYLVEGRKVRVPSNYNPETRQYVGFWDGTFKIAEEYTDNAVWCWLDLLTHPRYSIGKQMGLQYVNVWSLFRAAQKADQLVPDGEGGEEPRWRMSTQIRQQQDAWKVLVNYATAFAAQPFWDGSSASLMEDAVADVRHEFSNVNVIEGRFEYSTTPISKQINRVSIRYANEKDLYRPTLVIREDREAIVRFGVREQSFDTFWAPSKGQAERYAELLLQSERSSEGIRFRTGLEHAQVLPGEVFEVADRQKGSKRETGRVRSHSGLVVELDREVTLENLAEPYELMVALPYEKHEVFAPGNEVEIILPTKILNGDFRAVRVWEDVDGDGEPETRRDPAGWVDATRTLRLTPLAVTDQPRLFVVEYSLGIETRTVTSPPGVHQSLEVDAGFPVQVRPTAIWVLARPNTKKSLWRAVTIQPDKHTATIVGVEYRPEKFPKIDNAAIPFIDPDFSPPVGESRLPPPVQRLRVSVQILQQNGRAAPHFLVDWEPPLPSLPGSATVVGYRVSWAQDANPLEPFGGRVLDSQLLIPASEFGLFRFSVSAERYDGKLGPPVSTAFAYNEDTVPQLSLVVTGLHVEGHPGENVWLGKDIPLVWFTRTLGATDSGDISGDPADALFSHFVVRVFDANLNLLREVSPVNVQRFVYTLDMNREDGLHRDLTFEVAAVAKFTGKETQPDRLRVTNVAPPVPSGLVAREGTFSVWLEFTNLDLLEHPDLEGYLAWAVVKEGAETTFTPSDENLVARGFGTPLRIPTKEGTTYLVRMAAFDSFSENPNTLALSGTFEVRTGLVTGIADDVIDSEHLRDEAVIPGKVKVWMVKNSGSVFPVPATEGQVFYRVDLDQVFRFESGAWVEKEPDENGVIAETGHFLLLNASRINVGTLAADRIGTRVLGVEKLVVADFQNYATDGVFDLNAETGVPLSELWLQQTGTGSFWLTSPAFSSLSPRAGGHVGVLIKTQAGVDSYLMSPPDLIPVSLDDRYTVSTAIAVTLNPLASGVAGLGIRWFDKDRVFLSMTEQLPALSVPDQWQEVLIERVVPPPLARYAAAGPLVKGAGATLITVGFSNVVFRRSVGSAFIEDLKADRITTGTLDAATVISIGETIQINGSEGAITVRDQQNPPIERVRLGKTGLGSEDFGLVIRNRKGEKIIDADGLGLEVVGTTNLQVGAVNNRVVFNEPVWVTVSPEGSNGLFLTRQPFDVKGFPAVVEVRAQARLPVNDPRGLSVNSLSLRRDGQEILRSSDSINMLDVSVGLGGHEYALFVDMGSQASASQVSNFVQVVFVIREILG